jgi:hypothetical protein
MRFTMLSELSMIPKGGNHDELYSVLIGWPLVALGGPRPRATQGLEGHLIT